MWKKPNEAAVTTRALSSTSIISSYKRLVMCYRTLDIKILNLCYPVKKVVDKKTEISQIRSYNHQNNWF